MYLEKSPLQYPTHNDYRLILPTTSYCHSLELHSQSRHLRYSAAIIAGSCFNCVAVVLAAHRPPTKLRLAEIEPFPTPSSSFDYQTSSSPPRPAPVHHQVHVCEHILCQQLRWPSRAPRRRTSYIPHQTPIRIPLHSSLTDLIRSFQI